MKKRLALPIHKLQNFGTFLKNEMKNKVEKTVKSIGGEEGRGGGGAGKMINIFYCPQ
jgi:hypothetical protein